VPQPARSLPRLQLPLWAKWVLSFAVGAVLLVALIIFVDHNNTDSPRSQNLAAQTRANQEAALVVERDQAPHVIKLRHDATPVTGFIGAVRATMTDLVNRGIVDGPLQKVRCTRHGGGAGAPALTCVATANDVNYDFVGVVNLREHRLTYCKRDEPPVPSMNIPVSPRCVD
jgi:hypothetical protein